MVSLLACWCAGCLSSDAPAAKAWTLDAAPSAPAAGVLEGAGKAAFTTTRVGAVSVDAPYDKTPFVVRRADGSVAFDHYNVFAASPAALLRAPVRNRIGADGRFGSVVSPSSAAWADAQVEVQVTDLSLDCRTDGRRRARAALALDVVKAGRGPRTVALQGISGLFLCGKLAVGEHGDQVKTENGVALGQAALTAVLIHAVAHQIPQGEGQRNAV